MHFHGIFRWVLFLSLAFPGGIARAQMGMGMGGMQQPGDRDEKDMVIKRGDDVQDALPAAANDDDYLNRIPSFQLFDLHGYMRLRSDYLYRLDLGMHNHAGVSSPFLSPLTSYATLCEQPNAPRRCRAHTLTSTNMRLRLQPVLRPTDSVSIFTTFDVFDNLVLGSTPSGWAYGFGNASWAAVPGMNGTQATVDDGTTTAWDAIRVKHVWGRVDLKAADLVFGRMPDTFGMGAFRNDGSGIDDDYGDAVDRVGLMSEIPMWKLKAELYWDFASQGITSQALKPEQDQGQPVDADDMDDATRWTLTLSRRDSPSALARRIALGRPVFNWSASIGFLQQRYSTRNTLDAASTPTLSAPPAESDLAAVIVPRKAMLLSPGLWGFFARKSITLEAEAAMRYGWVTHLQDIPNMEKDGNDMNILSWGGVVRFGYRWSGNVQLYLETGYASGDDQYENTARRGAVHFTSLPAFPVNPRDAWNNLMLFHPSYHVDLIFFREIMGTVYNATYIKPTFKYSQGQWHLRIDGIASFANEPVATPGNNLFYGVELDADFSYRSLDGNFEAGLAYGLFYPMDAMQHPASIYGSLASDASMAHTIQGRILVRF